MIGISVGETTLGTTVANLGMDEVRFPKPVFHGDTLRVETRGPGDCANRTRGPTNGIVIFAHRAFNQQGEFVAVCKRSALMLRKLFGAAPESLFAPKKKASAAKAKPRAKSKTKTATKSKPKAKAKKKR